jgi:hypothetical protein
MTKLTITEVENAFQPAKEIDSAARFAGRPRCQMAWMPPTYTGTAAGGFRRVLA